MAIIKIKGREDLLKVKNEVADKIRDKWLGNNTKGIFKARSSDPLIIDGWSGIYGDIRSIELENFSTGPTEAELAIRQYQQTHRELRQLPADKKARRFGFFELFWWVFTGSKEYSKEIEDKVVSIQTDFFSKNTNRTLCDLELFKPLIGSHTIPEPEKDSMAPLIHKAGVRILVDLLTQDIREARYA